MDIALGFLTFGTLGSVVVFAYMSARLADKQLAETRRGVGGRKSALSSDGIAERLAAQKT